MKQLTFVAARGAAVTPSDTDTFGPSLIYIGGAGTVTIEDVKGSQVAFTAVAGAVLPVLATKVRTGGTATLMVRCF